MVGVYDSFNKRQAISHHCPKLRLGIAKSRSARGMIAASISAFAD
jgi:hypothetical protein